MRKGDLKGFVAEMVSNKRTPLYEQVADLEQNACKKFTEKWLSQQHVIDIQNLAEQLAELAGEFEFSMPYHNYNIGNVRTYFGDFRSDVESRFMTRFYHARTGEGQQDLTVYGLDASEEITELVSLVKPIWQKIAELDKLGSQMDTMITVSRNGKDAYKNLVAAGVDMSEFSEQLTMLPTVVKLTVDPKILKDGE
jgi:hypothetical protein